MSRKLNLNINEIDSILNTYYRDKVSSTQISKIMKISPSKVKNVIKDYSTIYLNKHPEYKPIDDISTESYEQHILSSSYVPATLNVPNRKKKKDDIEESPYCD
jgi:hypothetical protein